MPYLALCSVTFSFADGNEMCKPLRDYSIISKIEWAVVFFLKKKKKSDLRTTALFSL